MHTPVARGSRIGRRVDQRVLPGVMTTRVYLEVGCCLFTVSSVWVLVSINLTSWLHEALDAGVSELLDCVALSRELAITNRGGGAHPRRAYTFPIFLLPDENARLGNDNLLSVPGMPVMVRHLDHLKWGSGGHSSRFGTLCRVTSRVPPLTPQAG
jgi:hypothetical protein